MTIPSPATVASITQKKRPPIWPFVVVALAAFLRVYLLSSVPFGWHPDEATKALLARDVLAGKVHPVFFSAFTGRDALYVYLEAGAFALMGEGMFAGRLLSAYVGLLTVAATYTLGRVLINRRVGVLGAALLAVSLWHLIASRNSYRAVIQPLIQVLAFCFLFRGWRQLTGSGWRRSWPFAVAGLFLGLTQYTYTAGRAFPLLMIAVVLLARVTAPAMVTRNGRPVLLMFLVAAAVCLPLGVHFLQNPADFYGRATQVSVLNPAWAGGDPWDRLWQSVRETVGMFTQWGDPNYRFNLSGRPVFGLVDGALFYGGLALSLLFARRGSGWHRGRYVVLFLWVGIMLLPMTLSAESLPYYQRAIGILPAVYFFPALSLDAVASWMERREPVSRAPQRLARLLLVLILAWLTAQVCRAYFSDWHAAEQNDDDRRVAMVYAADYAKDLQLAGELYISTEYSEHPTLAFLAPERFDGVLWFDARQSLPLPPVGVEATYLLLTENPPQPMLMDRAPDLHRVETALDRFGRAVFYVYRWKDGASPTPPASSPVTWSWEVTFEPGDPQGLRHAIALPVNLGDVMALVGYDRSTDAVGPGEILELVLYWQLQRRPDRHYSIFAHLLDSESHIVAEYDANRYPTPFWQKSGGEMLLSYFPLRLEQDSAPGEYQLEIGVYHQPTGERLPVYDGSQSVADRLLLRPVSVR